MYSIKDPKTRYLVRPVSDANLARDTAVVMITGYSVAVEKLTERIGNPSVMSLSAPQGLPDEMQPVGNERFLAVTIHPDDHRTYARFADFLYDMRNGNSLPEVQRVERALESILGQSMAIDGDTGTPPAPRRLR